MADVIGLDGKAVTQPGIPITPLSVLKDLVAKIEAGEEEFEQVLIIGTVPRPGGTVAHRTYDNGLTVAETIYMAEVIKADIFHMVREAAR